VYGSFNHLLTETDSAGRVEVRNTWRNITLPGTGVEVYPGPMISATDANGAVTSFGYDPVTGELNRITDPTGASSSIVTDGRGYTVAEIDALGRRTDYVVDDLGRRLEMRRSRTKSDGSVELLVTRYAYDASGNLVETEHPDGSVTRSEYDLTGRVTAQVDALGRRTEYEYNDRGDETEVRHPDGSVESRSYDASGNLVAQTDALGAVTKFVYDSMNRLVETIHPDETPASEADNPRSRSVYDAAGQMIESIDANGHTTRYEYDDAGRRTRTVLAAVDGVTATVTDAYDVSGRRTSSTDAAGNVTLFRYDAAGRLVETEQDGAIIRFEHDAAGRKVAEIDPAGRVTRYVHDALGRIISVVLPNPSTGANPPLVAGSSPDSGTLTTRYVYDEVGNKLSQTDAEGRVTRWEYDAMGRETARILPEGQRETKRYNAAGELVESTDFNGESTRYGYDGAGRVERIDYPTDTDVAFRHNAAGLRISVTDARGDSTTAFDSRGRVVRSRDADGGAIEYSYDAAGNLLSRASPSQSLVYVYDARNRLSQVTRTVDGELPTVTRYEYDANGNRIAMLGGDGIRTEYAYDDRHRLTNLVKKTGTGLTLLAMNYTVDSSGMRTAVEESDSSGPLRTVVFGYDAARRLTREAIDHRDSVEDRVSAWTYDRVGNRLSQTVTTSAATETTTYAYDDNDRLEQEIRTGGADPGTTSYGYDANGNTLTKVAPSGTTTYRYDDANRLVQATTPEGVTSYVYSADGLRVRQLHTPSGGPTATTWYVQDSAYPYAQVIEEYKSVGSEPKRLAATFTFADDLVSQTRYDSAGVPTTHFVQADGFGSTRWLTDASGGLTDSIEYDAFGSEISRTGSTDVEHLHRAERFDANVGHYDLRARLYNPANGRFLTQDTFLGVAADPQSLHKYLYANANPVLYSDPSGNMSLTEMGTALNTMARLAVSSVRIVGRSSIRKARAVVKYWIATAKTAVRRCIQKPERCDLDTPLIIEGNDTPHTSRHVRDAQLGGGSNLFPSGVLFHRTAPPANRRWYRGMAECNKSARGLFGGLAACDEFPYATAKEGGPGNYPIRTSLRLVPIIEASPQGVKLEAFYRLCGIQRDHPKKSEFLAIGMPEVHSLVLPPPLSCFDSK
jgi:RHS repeat-associated protein